MKRKDQIDFILQLLDQSRPLTISRPTLDERLSKIETEIERLRNIIEGKISFSPRKVKIKKRIVEVLKIKKKLSLDDLAKEIGLSKSRTCEYLIELTKEGVVVGYLKDRKKIYRLRKYENYSFGEW